MTILDVIMQFSEYFCLTFLRCTSELVFCLCLFFNYTEQNGTAVPNWRMFKKKVNWVNFNRTLYRLIVLAWPTFLFLAFTGAGPLDSIHLSAPFVAVKNKEVNLTVVLWPSQVGTVTYIWWFGNNSEVRSH